MRFRRRHDDLPNESPKALGGLLSAQTLVRAMDYVEEHVAIFDLGYTLHFANRALLESRCLSAEEARGQNCDWLLAGSDCCLEEIHSSGRPWKGRIQYLDPAGETRCIKELEVNPFPSELGPPLMLCIARDISDLDRAVERARVARKQLRQVQETFIDGPVVVFRWQNAEGWPVEYVSPNVEAEFGYTADDLLSGATPYSELIAKDDLLRVGEEVTENSADGVSHFTHDPYRLVRRDGKIIWVLDHTSIIRNELGEITHYLGYIIDITARRELEEHQREMTRQMRHTQKLESLGVLAGGIAHDFNNLLTAIMGNAEIALSQLTSGCPAQGSIQRIVETGRRAAELANQMLAYSGKGRFVVEPLRLDEVVEEMMQLLSVSISKAVVLECSYAEESTWVECDVTQIRQVIMNLITNASEAVADEGGVISVVTGAKQCDQKYLRSCQGQDDLPEGLYSFIEVKDQGYGMDVQTLARFFEPFFTTKFAGRGLGMSAVLGIVRGHRGAIRVKSKPGKGTTIKVLFPTIKEPSTALVRQGEKAIEAERPLGGTVLVVDDEEVVRIVAQKMLEQRGYVVLTAVDGLQAIDAMKASTSEIDCVLLDLTMPNMDGERTFRELRRMYPDLPIVMFSGYSEHEFGERFAGGAIPAFINKPFSPTTLVTTIQKVMMDASGKKEELD